MMTEAAKPDTPTQEDWVMISFKVPPDLKEALDRVAFEQKTTIRELCTKGLTQVGVRIAKGRS